MKKSGILFIAIFAVFMLVACNRAGNGNGNSSGSGIIISTSSDASVSSVFVIPPAAFVGKNTYFIVKVLTRSSVTCKIEGDHEQYFNVHNRTYTRYMNVNSYVLEATPTREGTFPFNLNCGGQSIPLSIKLLPASMAGGSTLVLPKSPMHTTLPPSGTIEIYYQNDVLAVTDEYEDDVFPKIKFGAPSAENLIDYTTADYTESGNTGAKSTTLKITDGGYANLLCNVDFIPSGWYEFLYADADFGIVGVKDYGRWKEYSQMHMTAGWNAVLKYSDGVNTYTTVAPMPTRCYWMDR